MNKEKLTELYKKYNLTKDDVFSHQHYLIITRSGIEKLMAQSNITINYEVIRCEPNFAVIKEHPDLTKPMRPYNSPRM